MCICYLDLRRDLAIFIPLQSLFKATTALSFQIKTISHKYLRFMILGYLYTS